MRDVTNRPDLADPGPISQVEATNDYFRDFIGEYEDGSPERYSDIFFQLLTQRLMIMSQFRTRSLTLQPAKSLEFSP
jgi:hypothetical protein